ncbi:hypothetical protein ACFVAD_21460 [Sutcliffiella sp. NPDC057660]|uniref:hypothetical protein n=1 Tax=Sutcliffiella sp. NPDC057660 TaxID=3346199 RepID=UPI0036788861
MDPFDGTLDPDCPVLDPVSAFSDPNLPVLDPHIKKTTFTRQPSSIIFQFTEWLVNVT